MSEFSKKAKWIRRDGICAANWEAKVLPAPHLRKEFKLAKKPREAKIKICGLGFHELLLNGRKVGDSVLDPVVTQYDKRVRFVVHDVTELLNEGANAVGVILGNGWCNCSTPDVWHFDKASWRDYPKLLLELEIDGETALVSDESWKCADGPIVFDALRNGETYDASKELGDWASVGCDDSAWKPCGRVSPPGGILEEQTMPPCKVMETVKPVAKLPLSNGAFACDFGQNLTGWCRIRVKGPRGKSITLMHGERVMKPGGNVDRNHIGIFIKDGRVQTDVYILKGEGEEVWEPRFAYHGFQYTEARADEGVELLEIEARFVRTSFETAGSFSCSDETLNKLQDCALRSYKSNFTGIPTDCPHREKNGWTGDAQLAVETGLFNFDAGSSYAHWMASFRDVQRPSGQLPGIVPSCGWGFNWGSGPAWDSALILIPWNVLLFTGDLSIVKDNYDAMKLYMDYCESMEDEGVLSFGLGDWCHVDRRRAPSVALTSTAFYRLDAQAMARIAKLLGKREDQERFDTLEKRVKKAFNAKFGKGDGLYGEGETTALACAIHCGFAEGEERKAAAKRLAKAVEENNCKADFGILGAKWVPRALTETGRADLAFKLLTQKEFPGWGFWIASGASTLWESWSGDASLNHIMFGDVSAWMHQHLAGLSPDPDAPGFKRSLVRPNFVKEVAWAKASRKTAFGELAVAWRREGRVVETTVEIPSKCSALVELPDGTRVEKSGGRHVLKCESEAF